MSYPQIEGPHCTAVTRRTTIAYTVSPGGHSRRTEVRVCGIGSTCGTNAEAVTRYDYWNETFLPTLERRTDGVTGQALETCTTYDSAGRPLSTDGPLPGSGDATYNRYDVHGRRTWQIGPAGADGTRTATRTDYRKSDDKVLTVWSGTLPDAESSALAVASRSDTRYDARRNPYLEFVSEADGTTRTVLGRRFDQRNRLVCEARRMNQGNFGALPDNACELAEEPTPGSNGPDRITHNEYDDAGQLLRVRRGYGTALEQIYAAYEYDGNGNRTSVTDANGNRAELRYDGYGRQVRWVFPHPSATGQVNEGDFEAYRYDDAGNRIELRKRDGTVIGYEYDGRNRLTQDGAGVGQRRGAGREARSSRRACRRRSRRSGRSAPHARRRRRQWRRVSRGRGAACR